jgi:hypothetical protein
MTMTSVGLVAWLPFSGGSLADASGNNNGAVAVGSPSATTGPFGLPALAVNGSSANAHIPYTDTGFHLITDNNANAGTWSIWFKTTSTGNIPLLALNYSLHSWWGITFLCQAGAVTAYMTGGTNALTAPSVAGTPQDGNWHHAAISWDYNPASYTTSPIKVYLDGVVASVFFDNGWQGFEANENLNIGTDSDSFWGSMVGSVADVRIYNRALSDPEVLGLYTGVTSPSRPSNSSILLLGV